MKNKMDKWDRGKLRDVGFGAIYTYVILIGLSLLTLPVVLFGSYNVVALLIYMLVGLTAVVLMKYYWNTIADMRTSAPSEAGYVMVGIAIAVILYAYLIIQSLAIDMLILHLFAAIIGGGLADYLYNKGYLDKIM